MSRLDSIAVRVVQPFEAPSGNGSALLRELAELLEGLAVRGESSSIDLRSLPLTPGDYHELREALGKGVVTAHLDAAGTTEICETACPGAWWVTHRGETGEVLAELIEICPVPAILAAPAEDVAQGLERLRQTLADFPNAAAPAAAQGAR